MRRSASLLAVVAFLPPLGLGCSEDEASTSSGATGTAASTGGAGGAGSTTSASTATGAGGDVGPGAGGAGGSLAARAGDVAHGVAIDDAGDVAGAAEGEVDLFGGGPTGGAGRNAVVARLDASLGLGWVRAHPNGEAVRVAFDPAGGAVVTGHFTGTIDLGAGPLVNPGSADNTFVVRYGI